MDKTITLRPRLSEKTYGLSESRVYVLEIPNGVNKHGVARAVEAQFEVKVLKVNIANISGKSKRIMSITGKRVKNAEGRRPGIKKAYITLAEGHSLPFFNAIEEEETKEQELQEKLDKAAAKQADKADKPARRGFRLPKKKSKAEEETE
jgi:large subunit ribosomal protein L23